MEEINVKESECYCNTNEKVMQI